MAKRIIALNILDNGNIRIALWLNVPVQRQSFFADAGKTSEWSGALATENTAIQLGEIHEEIHILSSLGKSNNDLKAEAEILLASRQAAFNLDNPWMVYGTFYDDQTQSWTNGGVA